MVTGQARLFLLFFPLEKLHLPQNPLQDTHARAPDVQVWIGRFQVENEEIGMLILFYPAQDPSDRMPILSVPQGGLISKLVIGIVLRLHHTANHYLRMLEKRQLIEI